MSFLITSASFPLKVSAQYTTLKWPIMHIEDNNFILCTKIQKVDGLPRQIPGKLVVAGQDKYMNNKTYLIKTKTFNY